MAATEAQSPTNGENGQVDLSTIPISPTGVDGEEKKPHTESEQITVFHDKDNFNVKHPLMHKWTLWFTKPPSGKVKANKMSDICTTDSYRGTTGTIY